MKAIGQIEISGIRKPLNNPTLEIAKVVYDWKNHNVDIECLFTEEGANNDYSRTYNFPTNGSGELTSIDIMNLIKGHNILKAFK